VILLAAALIIGEGLLVPWAIAALGCEFMVGLYLRNDAAPLTAAAYGAVHLLVAELASWSIELRLPARVEAHLGVRRAVAVTILVVASLVVGLIAASLAQTTIPGTLALMAVGLGALIAALIIVATLVWRPRSNRT
jgi:hypothetical protein